MADESRVTLKSLNCFTICYNETTYPGHIMIRFLCDSDITFSLGLHKKLVTVLYFSIINVLCGAVETQALPLRQILCHYVFKH